jgi:hypothetical protein
LYSGCAARFLQGDQNFRHIGRLFTLGKLLKISEVAEILGQGGQIERIFAYLFIV